ncbi:MAG: hypothetical protein ACRDSR_26645 [Pseudonocardiaceae bacterium]
MTLGGGFFVQTAALDKIAVAAARVAEGVMRIGDDVVTMPTMPSEYYGEWLLGDRSIDLVAAWDDLLHAFAEDIRTIGQKVGKTSKLYTGTDEDSGTFFGGILS